jgi:hypothetical protein
MVDEDAMDWAPTNPPAGNRVLPRRTDDDGSWLRPQRFFPPEQPTGLEGLFARTGLTDAVSTSQSASSGSNRNNVATQWHWGWVYAASLIPVIGIAAHAWSSRQIAPVTVVAPPKIPSYIPYDTTPT